MFERFTEAARTVVKAAVERAERAGAGSVTEEHLLLALLDLEGTPSAAALDRLGVAARRDQVVAALAEAARRAGLTRADAEALAGLGIDVAEIVSRVEAVHGTGALRGDRRVRRRLGGGGRLTTEAKGVLERSLRVALGRGDRYIGDEHLLLALAARPGPVADVLAEQGATYGALERALAKGAEGGEPGEGAVA
ncbi:Clp protease N-terminal domain-containing protein [Streptomyces lichenis]|uniref:Peptidase n=1 Tax=Streptomyces lichenis TaxID=2306967 RepID=A0ABT0I7U0_9ACTN|nr:Clp protease N-terminal domain-containing protein [Streptomyces lichenis]MCK8677389.1 peptidase [Streptomyces lichenis]